MKIVLVSVLLAVVAAAAAAYLRLKMARVSTSSLAFLRGPCPTGE